MNADIGGFQVGAGGRKAGPLYLSEDQSGTSNKKTDLESVRRAEPFRSWGRKKN